MTKVNGKVCRGQAFSVFSIGFSACIIGRGEGGGLSICSRKEQQRVWDPLLHEDVGGVGLPLYQTDTSAVVSVPPCWNVPYWVWVQKTAWILLSLYSEAVGSSLFTDMTSRMKVFKVTRLGQYSYFSQRRYDSPMSVISSSQ